MGKLLLVLAFMSFFSFSLAKEVPFTQEDRDRLIRLEVKVENLEKRIDELRGLMLWGFGILFGGMGILIGLVMWDRRTAISPVVKKAKELEDKSERVEKILRDLAKEDQKIAEALKRAGLL
ncbi:MAG: hypothetical protein ACK4OF_04015 [Aquificaceae bacterium]